jgi:hypothetical protein
LEPAQLEKQGLFSGHFLFITSMQVNKDNIEAGTSVDFILSMFRKPRPADLVEKKSAEKKSSIPPIQPGAVF